MPDTVSLHLLAVKDPKYLEVNNEKKCKSISIHEFCFKDDHSKRSKFHQLKHFSIYCELLLLPRLLVVHVLHN